MVSSTNVGAVTPPQFTVTKISNLSSPALPGQVGPVHHQHHNTTPLAPDGNQRSRRSSRGHELRRREHGAPSSAPPQTVSDLVNAAAYTNNNGTRNWSGNWTETGDDGDVNAGRRPGPDDLAALFGSSFGQRQQTVTRAANLTGFRRPTLSFFARRVGLDSLASTSPFRSLRNGGPFTEIGRFAGPTNDAAYALLQLRRHRLHLGEHPDPVRLSRGAWMDDDQVFFDDVTDLDRRPLRTFRDDFNAVSYANNDGTLNWSTTWTETGTTTTSSARATWSSSTDNLGANRLFVENDNNAASAQANLTGIHLRYAELPVPARRASMRR